MSMKRFVFVLAVMVGWCGLGGSWGDAIRQQAAYHVAPSGAPPAEFTFVQGSTNSDYYLLFANYETNKVYAGNFVMGQSCTIGQIDVRLRRTRSSPGPSGFITAYLLNSATNIIATATNVVYPTNVVVQPDYDWEAFYFDQQVTNGATYFLCLSNSTVVGTSDFYNWGADYVARQVINSSNMANWGTYNGRLVAYRIWKK